MPRDERPPDDTAQRAPRVRRDRVTMVQHAWRDGEGGIRIPNDEIGVATHRDGALARGEAGDVCRRGAHPARQVPDRAAAPACFRPHDRQRQLQSRDATPGRGEVAGFEPLQVRRARGVIGHHHVDDAAAERIPESRLIFTAADRRGALEVGRTIGHVLGGERQIVRAGFDRDREALGARLGEERQRIRRRQVHDVNGAAGLARQAHDEADRSDLPLGRS